MNDHDGAEALLSRTGGMTFLDRCEPHPAEAATVRPVLTDARRAELRAALVAAVEEGRRYFGAPMS